MQNFLQLLMDVVLLIAQKQGEEEEEEEEVDPRDELKAQLGEDSGNQDSPEQDEENKDETDTQKLAQDLGLNPAERSSTKKHARSESDPGDDKPGDLDFYNPDKEPQQLIDVEDDAMVLNEGKMEDDTDIVVGGEEEDDLDEMMERHSPPKHNQPPIDVFNDPLLPEDLDP